MCKSSNKRIGGADHWIDISRWWDRAPRQPDLTVRSGCMSCSSITSVICIDCHRSVWIRSCSNDPVHKIRAVLVQSTQSCPRVTFLGPDPTRPDPTRPDPTRGSIRPVDNSESTPRSLTNGSLNNYCHWVQYNITCMFHQPFFINQFCYDHQPQYVSSNQASPTMPRQPCLAVMPH